MSSKKISQFTTVIDPQGSDIFLFDHKNVTSTVSLDTISTFIRKSGATTSTAVDAIPVGSILWFTKSTAPIGFLECSGLAVSRATYSDLFKIIGTTFGGGDGTSTFNLPDLRGEFIRGWDHLKGIDNGRTFGSNQSDEFKAHAHTYQTKENRDNPSYNAWNGQSGVGMFSNDTSTVGGTETRPRNVALLPCIKALPTATGDTTTLNFISKPINPSSGQVLTYSNNAWTASTLTLNFIPKPATTTSSPANFDVLTYNKSTSAWGANSLANINNGTFLLNGSYIPKPATATGGQFLTYNATNATWSPYTLPDYIPKPSSASSLNVLAYDQSNARWQATTLGSINDLTGNFITKPSSASTNQVLTYIDNTWKPSSILNNYATKAELGNYAPRTDFTGTGNQSGEAQGYQLLPGGLIIQWGNVNGPNSNTDYTFPTTFRNVALQICVTNRDQQGDRVDNAFGYIVDNSKFRVATKSSASNGISTYAVTWIAVGY